MKLPLLATFGLALVLSAWANASPSAREYNLRTMTAEEIDHAALGQPRYDFFIAADEGLIDARGRRIRASELPAYLKENAAVADAFYFLWITPTSAPMDSLAPTIKPLGDYGITKIVVRHQPLIVTHRKATEPAKELEKTMRALRGEAPPI